MEVTTIAENSTYGLSLDYEIETLSLANRAVLTAFLLLSMLLSLLGNTFTCLIVYRKKPMRSAINLLLTNIATSDLILTLAVAPFVLYNMLKTNISVFGMCVCFSVLKDACICVTSYTLLVISVDRYLIIVHRKDRLCPKMAKGIILIIWFGSVCISIPQFLSFAKEEFVTFDKIFCYDSVSVSISNFRLSYALILLSVTFYIPVVVMFYLYAAILRTVQLSSKRIHNHSGSTVSISVTQYSSKLGLPTVAVPYRFTGDFNAKRKAFGTILLIFITLFCCWLPYTTNRIITLGASRQILVETILLTLGFLKSALYPIIFCARNKKFRVACRRFLPSSLQIPKTCIQRKQRRVDPKSVYKCSEFETRI
ncbi:high-affinity lysophosphatidic acid receptor-like [Mercenaria mercenaria]|uniref:high-affinity lysophosphatidic acid receptor-like n=1 Tax=Mercenaria mercenaria TaxID=6596 RepID=UPI00234EED2C|nr:high-affinity lysophosphatidic acid receptor-like [Mercenaria mercenaria]